MTRSLVGAALVLACVGLAGCTTSDKSREQVEQEIEPGSISDEQMQNEVNQEENRGSGERR